MHSSVLSVEAAAPPGAVLHLVSGTWLPAGAGRVSPAICLESVGGLGGSRRKDLACCLVAALVQCPVVSHPAQKEATQRPMKPGRGGEAPS